MSENSVTVSVHKLTINHKSEIKTDKHLTTELLKGKNIGDLLVEFIEQLQRDLPEEEFDEDTTLQPDEQKRSNKILLFDRTPETFIEQETIFISGQVIVAIDGYSALYKHRETGEQWQRTPEYYEHRPYFFMLAIPKKERFGLCFIQREGIHGITVPFYYGLHGYIQRRAADFIFKYEPFTTDAIIHKYKEYGDIKKVILVRHERVMDSSDSDSEPKKRFQAITKTELKLPRPRKKIATKEKNGTSEEQTDQQLEKYTYTFFEKLLRKGEKKPNEEGHFITVEGLGLKDEYDDLILQVDMNGKSRTFSITDPNRNFHPNMVLENVTTTDGNPSYKSLKSKCKDLYYDLMSDASYVY